MYITEIIWRYLRLLFILIIIRIKSLVRLTLPYLYSRSDSISGCCKFAKRHFLLQKMKASLPKVYRKKIMNSLSDSLSRETKCSQGTELWLEIFGDGRCSQGTELWEEIFGVRRKATEVDLGLYWRFCHVRGHRSAVF